MNLNVPSIPILSIEDIRNIQLRPISYVLGDQIEAKDWLRDVRLSSVTLHDGHAYLATFTEESNISAWDVLAESSTLWPLWATHVIWYPK